MKRFFCFLLAFLVAFGITPVMKAKADVTDGLGAGAGTGSDVTTTYQRDRNYVKPDDNVYVWDSGDCICVSGGGDIYRIPYGNLHYLVAISKYLDSDGEYTAQIDIWLTVPSFSTSSYRGGFYRRETETFVADDGSTYFSIYAISQSHSVYFYRFRLRGSLFQTNKGEWIEESTFYGYSMTTSTGTPKSYGALYATPYFKGLYKIYCSLYVGDADEWEGYNLAEFAVNLLPNAPTDSSLSSMPYKTTFRMLSENAITYNTFYYSASFLSGSDTVSASGKIKCATTKLSNGAISFVSLTAPQLLCQISSYGTAYDIAYTNDDNLCELLGIEKPAAKYWDVEAQEWKKASSSIVSGFGSGANTGSGVGDVSSGNSGNASTSDTSHSSAGWHFDNDIRPSDGYLYLFDKFMLYCATYATAGVVGTNKLISWIWEDEKSFDGALMQFLSHAAYDTATGVYGYSESEKGNFEDSPDADEIVSQFHSQLRYDDASSVYYLVVNSGSASSGDTTIGNGVANGVSGIADMAKEIVNAFKTLLANIGEMGGVVKTLFGFLPDEMLGFIRITMYTCLFIAFYKMLRG